jgi:D-sedoheptulose 7-phosphate isomerase
MNSGGRPLDLSATVALRQAHPELGDAVDDLGRAAGILTRTLDGGGIVYLAGNGGSMADALHVAGELKKSFERHRPLPADLALRLREHEGGRELAAGLEAGLRVLVLGADPVLTSAVDNDIATRHAVFAQELVAMGRTGDALMILSTSGRSPNTINAAIVARSLDMAVVVLTGAEPSPRLTALAHVIVRAPSTVTAEVQIWHSRLYHVLCRILEDTHFPQAAQVS